MVESLLELGLPVRRRRREGNAQVQNPSARVNAVDDGVGQLARARAGGVGAAGAGSRKSAAPVACSRGRSPARQNLASLTGCRLHTCHAPAPPRPHAPKVRSPARKAIGYSRSQDQRGLRQRGRQSAQPRPRVCRPSTPSDETGSPHPMASVRSAYSAASTANCTLPHVKSKKKATKLQRCSQGRGLPLRFRLRSGRQGLVDHLSAS